MNKMTEEWALKQIARYEKAQSEYENARTRKDLAQQELSNAADELGRLFAEQVYEILRGDIVTYSRREGYHGGTKNRRIKVKNFGIRTDELVLYGNVINGKGESGNYTDVNLPLVEEDKQTYWITFVSTEHTEEK